MFVGSCSERELLWQFNNTLLYPFLRKGRCRENSHKHSVFVKILRHPNFLRILTSTFLVKKIEEGFEILVDHHQYLLGYR
jgi:hypothetical protein